MKAITIIFSAITIIFSAIILYFIINLMGSGVKELPIHNSHLEEIESRIEKYNLNKEYVMIVDYSIHSGLKRGKIFNIKKGYSEKTFLVAHGSGMGETKGVPNGFSNKVGSNASSLGYGVINERGWSNYGINIKYWIDGLDSSNSNMRKRVVVLHSWEGIPDKATYPSTIVMSQGCPTVSNNTMRYIDSLIQKQNNKKILILFKT